MKNQVIKIALSGASGRMGQAVKSLIRRKNSGCALLEQLPPSQSKALLWSQKEINQALSQWDFQKIHGVIDFSSPTLFNLTLKWCVAHQKPFVSGTTGLNSAQKKALKIASKKIPVFYEQNMSWGIWQIKTWIKQVAPSVSSILLQDIHHKHKKDKPSGTALKLKQHFPPWAKKKLTIKSRREGDVFGTHKIIFKGSEEWVTLEHKALSRKLFASGSLKALKWLIQKPPGFYSFEDLYGASK